MLINHSGKMVMDLYQSVGFNLAIDLMHLELRVVDGNLVHYWWGNDINVNSNQASLNNWLYIVAKFDGTTRSVWVNGVLAGQDTPSGHNVNSLIQISKTYGSEYQRGKIKVAMIYNRALSSNELSQNYTAITNPNSVSNRYNIILNVF